MQFSKLSQLAVLLALPIFAASQCNTASIQCCDSTETAGSPSGAALLALVGVAVQDPTVLLGVTCSPITSIGISEGGCSADPVCCENNNFNGVVAIGCVPITA